MYDQKNPGGIKSWAEADRPREKLLIKGRSSLSDAELIAILLGSGTKSCSALDVAKSLLAKADQDLNVLARFSFNKLKEEPGIGDARAISILAAMELYRRRLKAPVQEQPKIACSQDAYNFIRSELTDLGHEEFWVIYLNRSNTILRSRRVSSGGISGTVADPKVIFGNALEEKASSLILVHNHPSGNLKPSQADLSLTKKMVEAGQSLDLPVLDHLIFSERGYYSFADEGLL